MLVEEAMTEDLVTCDLEVRLGIAVDRMLDHGVGSVIVRSDGDPFGIVTETDALRAGAETGRPFHEIDVREALSRPLITTTGDVTIRKAVARMTDEGIKKLPVVEGLDLRGILTRSDVVENYDAVLREAHAIDERRERWEARKGDVDEF